jgi:hypothetical protein
VKYLFGLIVITFFVSCCKKKDCLPGQIREIDFALYTASDIDTIILRRFSKASNFNNLIDSIILNNSNSNFYPHGDTTVMNISDTSFLIKANYDYEIYIPPTNTVERINGITDKKTQHQVCTVCDCVQGPCYNPVTSFTLNGQIVSDDYIFIKK